MHLNFLKINKNISLTNLIEIFDNSKKTKDYKIAISLSKNNSIDGIISRGDLRRILSKKHQLEKPIKNFLNKNFFSVQEKNLNNNLYSSIKKFAIKRSKQFKINEIIVLDNKNKFKGILDLSKIKHLLKYKKICVVGLGHIGLPLLLFLSTKFNKINGYDNNRKKIDNIRKNNLNIYEKGLDKLLSHSLSHKKLLLSHNLNKVTSDIYIVCLGSEVINKKPSSSNLIKIANKISQVLKKDDLVILRGTVQAGFTRQYFKKIIEKKTKWICGKDFFIGFMPERLAEGNALEEIKTIPQVFAGYSYECSKIMTSFIEQIFQRYILCEKLEEAELIKLASNAYRDLNFAFANQISKVSRKFDLSGSELINKANYGYERNQISRPSIGVGGLCLPKDPTLLSKSLKKSNYNYILSDISKKANEDFLRFNLNRLNKILKKDINKKNIKIMIFGISFKSYPENIDTRNSIGLKIGNYLTKQKVKCYYYDKLNYLYNKKKLNIKIHNNLRNINNFDGIIVVNEHKDFKEILINNLSQNISKNKKIIFDTWNILDKDYITNLNWEYYNI